MKDICEIAEKMKDKRMELKPLANDNNNDLMLEIETTKDMQKLRCSDVIIEDEMLMVEFADGSFWNYPLYNVVRYSYKEVLNEKQ